MAMLTAAAERELAPEPATSCGWRPRHMLPRAPGASHGLVQRDLTFAADRGLSRGRPMNGSDEHTDQQGGTTMAIDNPTDAPCTGGPTAPPGESQAAAASPAEP